MPSDRADWLDRVGRAAAARGVPRAVRAVFFTRRWRRKPRWRFGLVSIARWHLAVFLKNFRFSRTENAHFADRCKLGAIDKLIYLRCSGVAR